MLLVCNGNEEYCIWLQLHENLVKQHVIAKLILATGLGLTPIIILSARGTLMTTVLQTRFHIFLNAHFMFVNNILHKTYTGRKCQTLPASQRQFQNLCRKLSGLNSWSCRTLFIWGNPILYSLKCTVCLRGIKWMLYYVLNSFFNLSLKIKQKLFMDLWIIYVLEGRRCWLLDRTALSRRNVNRLCNNTPASHFLGWKRKWWSCSRTGDKNSSATSDTSSSETPRIWSVNPHISSLALEWSWSSRLPIWDCWSFKDMSWERIFLVSGWIHTFCGPGLDPTHEGVGSIPRRSDQAQVGMEGWAALGFTELPIPSQHPPQQQSLQLSYACTYLLQRGSVYALKEAQTSWALWGAEICGPLQEAASSGLDGKMLLTSVVENYCKMQDRHRQAQGNPADSAKVC